MKKVTLSIIVSDDAEASTIAHLMENSNVAQEGFFTLECGHVEDLSDDEIDEVMAQVDEMTLQNNYYLDKDEDMIDIGDSVEVDATDENLDFTGTVVEYRGRYIVVEDQEENCFCMLPKQLKLAE